MSDASELPVLVVDDNEEMRRIVESVLGFYGYRAASLADGEAAQAYLDANVAPYLCLFDVTLSGLSGYDLLAHVEASDHPARVVLMSGKGFDDDMASPALLGFLQKPFGFDELKVLLDQFTG